MAFNRRSFSNTARDPREIVVKYATKCAETGVDLKVGDKAIYYPQSKSLYSVKSKQAQEFYNWQADLNAGHDY